MVPSYEEVVGSGMYPITQSSARHNSATQLPAYEELVENQQVEDGSNPARRHSSQTEPEPAAAAGGCKNNRPGRKLIPLKVRRIKSENLRRKSLSDAPQSFVFTIEPLTPPPQYDDEPIPLPPETQQWRFTLTLWWSVSTSFMKCSGTELRFHNLSQELSAVQRIMGQWCVKGNNSDCVPI